MNLLEKGICSLEDVKDKLMNGIKMQYA